MRARARGARARAGKFFARSFARARAEFCAQFCARARKIFFDATVVEGGFVNK